MQELKIGVIRETKVPEDTRTPLIPEDILELKEQFPELEVFVESSSIRCISDDEYRKSGIPVTDDLSNCDILLGVKEVNINHLLPDRTYMFFSHTIKAQEYNCDLLLNVLEKNIRLIDYEVITDENNIRLIGFGRFAGIVGAHHALLMWGKKTGSFHIKKAVDCVDYDEMISQYKELDFDSVKVLITGNGRVSNGSAEVLNAAGFTRVSVNDYLNEKFDIPVYVLCDMDELYMHREARPFDFQHFFDNPEEYDVVFDRFIPSTDVLINGMFWNPVAMRLFEKKRVTMDDFNMGIVSDISCDIDGSVPINYRATTIKEPYYGVDRKSLKEVKAFSPNSIDMMTVDNLPNELPLDASKQFSEVMARRIIPLLLQDENHEILRRATIAEGGKLTYYYEYLQDFVNGKL